MSESGQDVIFSTNFADSSAWQEIPQRWPNLATLGPTSTFLADSNLEEMAQRPELRKLWR